MRGVSIQENGPGRQRNADMPDKLRLLEDVTKGAGSRSAGFVMAFNLLHVAERYCRAVDAAEPVRLVRVGGRFGDGAQIESQNKRAKGGA